MRLRSGLRLCHSRTPFLCLQSTLVGLNAVSISVVLQGPVLFQLEFFTEHPLVHRRTCSEPDDELARSCCQKHIPKPWLVHLCVLQLGWGSFLGMLYLSSLLVSKYFNFSLIGPKNIIPEVLFFVHVLSRQTSVWAYCFPEPSSFHTFSYI